MTATEAYSNCVACGAKEPMEFFLYLAGHAHELRLENGSRLDDGTDFKAFLLEFALAAKAAVTV
jgi:hypothetical protein